MTFTQIAAHLKNPNLHADITFPEPRQAVKLAGDFMLDLADIELAFDLYESKPDDLRLQLLTDCIRKMKGRAA